MTTQANEISKRSATDGSEKNPETSNSPVSEGISLDELGLSTRVLAALDNAGIETAQDILDLLSQGETVFLDIPGIGPKASEEVQQRLIEKGLLEIKNEAVEVEQEHLARIQTEKNLREAQESLATTQAELKKQQLARSKAEQDLGEAKRSLIEIKKSAGVTLPTEPTNEAPGEEGGEHLHSFIVRVTTDEQGQPYRTEVEYVKGGKKKRFASLNVQLLATFIEESIRHTEAPERDLPSPARIDRQTPPEPVKTRLSITAVKVLRPGEPNGMDLNLNLDEDFVIETQFQLEGDMAISLSSQEADYQVKVITNDVSNGVVTELTSYTGNMVEDVIAYKVRMPVSGMTTGLYHLLTIVEIKEPVRMIAHYDGPTIVHREVVPA